MNRSRCWTRRQLSAPTTSLEGLGFRRSRSTFRGVQQALGGDAPDVRTRAAEPAPVDDGDRGTELARLVRGGLPGRAGADDDEVEGVHGHHRRGFGHLPPRWRRAS